MMVLFLINMPMLLLKIYKGCLCGMKFAIMGFVTAVLMLFSVIGFLSTDNVLAAGLCLVFGLVVTGTFRFLSDEDAFIIQ